MKIAFRGDGSHSRKIIKILKNQNPQFQPYFISREFKKEELEEDTKGLFICSPNSTHLNYLKLALTYNPYINIYCEKPLANKSSDVKEVLKILKSNKIYPGFNLRRSSIPNLLKNRVTAQFGKIKFFNVRVSYPFGYRNSFVDSWKSQKQYSPLGILENLAVHYIDLSYFLFGESTEKNIIFSAFKENIPLTIDIITKHKSGVLSNIHNSYFEAPQSIIEIGYENGLIKIKENEIIYMSPILKIDSKTNLSIKPPVIKKISHGLNFIFGNSLESSIKKFINICNSKECEIIDDDQNSTKSLLKVISDASKMLD